MAVPDKMTIGVVGAGLGGLAAACTLAARGYRVIVFEANSWLGGKASVWSDQGFRFDLGPTILTVPSVYRRIFAEAGRPLEQALELVRLDPQWRCFFEDGTQLDLWSDVSTMAAELERFSPGSAGGYEAFVRYATRLNDISQRFFFYKPVGGVRDTFDLGGLGQPGLLRDLRDLRPGRSVARTVRDHVPEPRVAQMLDHFTQYVGSDPHQSPAVLCGIAHMQLDEGVWYPIGGIGAVPQALVTLAHELGVEFRTGTPVARIVAEAGRVTGLVTEAGETVALGAVVANSDAVRTYRDLLRLPAAKALRRPLEPACSGVVLYLGLDRGYDHLAHHGFVFSRDPEEEFDAIYRRGEPAPDPTCYVAAPARTEPAVAPPGGEALYVLVHAPYLRDGQDWSSILPGYRRTILDKLARCGGMPDLESRIVVEQCFTPQDIHERYRVLQGAIYGLASHGTWSGAFKPSNRSQEVSGLYLAGGAAHPGPGMPMVAMSGWIAADALDQDGVAPRVRQTG